MPRRPAGQPPPSSSLHLSPLRGSLRPRSRKASIPASRFAGLQACRPRAIQEKESERPE